MTESRPFQSLYSRKGHRGNNSTEISENHTSPHIIFFRYMLWKKSSSSQKLLTSSFTMIVYMVLKYKLRVTAKLESFFLLSDVMRSLSVLDVI